MAESRADTESVLDREGEWELRMSIYRNGRRVAFCDVLSDDYEALAHWAVTHLQTRAITFTGRHARENDG